jgi:hypothetical protein
MFRSEIMALGPKVTSINGDEDLLQIPVPAGCQNGVSGSESRFLMAAVQRKSI